MCCLNTFTAAITVQNQYSSNWWRGSDRTIYIELTFWGAAYILKGGGQMSVAVGIAALVAEDC
jgi:TRAP-type mannitol/chloroaromatic compound transport system permease small subunit